eukprot:128709_1
MTASSMSKGFFEFVKSIGEAKSKQEEDGIIENELHILKAKMGARNVGARQMREYLIRMVYVEMLGHDASFGHIHAVKLTRAAKLVDKRVGYMACSLCLHKDHELMLLLVGGLQTDLQSQNQLEVSTALIASCKLINSDTIPAILPLVNKLLNHSEATIRKKAIMVIQRFNELGGDTVTDVADKAKRMLCDKDPSVMGASLHLLLDLIVTDEGKGEFNDLVSSFVSILKQIIEHRLPKDYDYHRMPAPWTQIKLLQILAMLGTANKSASEGMYEVLHEVMRRADIGINVGYAIIYECVRTVTTIYPNTQLLAEAAKCTSRFITSENHNLKYLGINALASIVQINPNAANEHQMIVIDCLEDKDETLRRKTLDLLYKMTNEKNVNVICTKLIISLRDSVDVYLRTQLIEKITFLAEKFAPDTIWFIDTMSQVFELGADLVKTQIAHNFVKTLSEGIIENQEDEESEEDIANYAADFFYQILVKNLKKRRKRIPNILTRIVCFVLGEYGQYCTGKPVDVDEDIEEEDELVALAPMEIIETLWSVIEKQGEDLNTRQWAMSATMKLCRFIDAEALLDMEEIGRIVSKYRASTHSTLVQLSHELTELCAEPDVMEYVFAESSVIDEVKVDTSLKFLNDTLVAQQLNEGKRRYAPPDSMDEDGLNEYDSHHHKHESTLIFDHVSKIKDLESTLVVKAVEHVGDEMDDDEMGSGGGGMGHMEQHHKQQDDHVEIQDFGLRRAKGPKPRWGDHVGRDDRDVDSDSDGVHHDDPVVTVTAHVAVPVHSSHPQSPSSSAAAAASFKANKKPLTEKEQVANLLFGGGEGAGLRRKKKVRKKRIMKKPGSKKAIKKAAVKQKKAKPKQNKPKVQQEKADDLLNFMSDEKQQNEAPQVVQQQQKAAKGNLLDMDDLLFGGAVPPPVTNNNKNSNLLDLFGTVISPQVSVAPQDKDLFGSMLGVNRGFAALKDKLGANIMGAIGRSHETDQILFDNSSLQVSYFKIYKPQKSTLCVFICNLSNATMTNIEISVKKDNTQCQLQFGFDVANSIPSPNLRNATTAIISQLAAGATSAMMVTFGLTNPTQLAMPCNIELSVNSEILQGIPLQMRDLIRAQNISTKDFGANWGKLSLGSFQVNMDSLNSSVANYVASLTKKLHAHHIQTIQNEVIAAANLSSIVNPNMLIPILIHCKCAKTQSYSIIVRTPNAIISKVIALELQQLLLS